MPTRYSIHNGDCFSAGGLRTAHGSGRDGAGWRGDRGRRREWLGQGHPAAAGGGVGETRIGRGAKVDNLVHVGHSCTIGQDTLLCAQVGLAGTTDVGNNVILAGQVGVSGHVKIGDGAIAIAQSGIPHDVPAGAMVSGAPAIDHRLWLKCCAAYAKLPEIARAVRKLSEH